MRSLRQGDLKEPLKLFILLRKALERGQRLPHKDLNGLFRGLLSRIDILSELLTRQCRAGWRPLPRLGLHRLPKAFRDGILNVENRCHRHAPILLLLLSRDLLCGYILTPLISQDHSRLVLLMLRLWQYNERAGQHVAGVVLQDVATERVRLHLQAGTFLGQQLAHHLLNRSICG